ncbi:hypothetical protein EB118_06530 [bacterium]|nr:hypothetical protein [bacterium]
MLNFPINPTLNQTFAPSSTTWKWDGAAWSLDQTSLSITGDATGSELNGVISLTLANTGITAGTYTKVTVDSKGRITLGTNFSQTDVTSALGYTPVSRAGDTMQGNLRLNNDPTHPLDAASKQYIDSKIWLAIAVGY